MKRLCFAALAAGSLLGLSALTATADTIGVSHCNGLSADGQSYGPGLMVVTPTGRVFYPIGASGLTTAEVYNQAAAFAWAERVLDLSPDDRLANYRDHACGSPIDDNEQEAEEQEEPIEPCQES